MFVTGFFAGYFGLLLAALALPIGLYRKNNQISQGVPDDKSGKHKRFECMVRAHGNAVEFIPIFLIMLGALEQLRVLPQSQVLLLGGVYAAIRTGHSLHIRYPGLPIILRMVGFLGSLAVLAGMGVMLMFHCYSQLF
mmetsp:Transcript_2995/g.7397  ORF Transcript_2995/g.7397 Transcript_2995/m.7397 type:complete len:137 (-) Transcript_2995:166-576(-)|eukprot:CAMPEP_0202862530 /NCGR_PEP_ID=MMETSP1391-20130828/3542_1 /ASSEMBLY_ACC=CAM_ASM_000867 /TAXON_ID=1034604 /ORGANISM="Chlamydomonas leiostraca, Strain SAG 11-49" /LENGTH=136 /DNA_ID=CAMNT_0049542079 /DNA_START=159 /DNA_END=569 /DNA_ORIENTATION=-